jgi:hypothetical protein
MHTSCFVVAAAVVTLTLVVSDGAAAEESLAVAVPSDAVVPIAPSAITIVYPIYRCSSCEQDYMARQEYKGKHPRCANCRVKDSKSGIKITVRRTKRDPGRRVTIMLHERVSDLERKVTEQFDIDMKVHQLVRVGSKKGALLDANQTCHECGLEEDATLQLQPRQP